MFRLKFMQKISIQTIVLILAGLFVLDMSYRLFLEKSYYLQPTEKGIVYRIDKRNGEVYVIYPSGMKKVEEVVSTKQKESLSFYDKEILGLEKDSSRDSIKNSTWDIVLPIAGVIVLFNVLAWWFIIQKRKSHISSLP